MKSMILVIEDSFDTFLLVEKALEGYCLEHAKSIEEAQQTLSQLQPELFLIDVELPDGNGLDFCIELNNNSLYQQSPKIILTARDAVSDKVNGLACGANDYITKPFASRELRARCEVQLRQLRQKIAKKMIGSFEFDLNFQTLFIRDESESFSPVLTPTEFRILYLLVSQPNKVFSREKIIRCLWTGHGTNIEKRGLDTHISHLRKKLKKHGKALKAVYGKGYTYTTS